MAKVKRFTTVRCRNCGRLIRKDWSAKVQLCKACKAKLGKKGKKR